MLFEIKNRWSGAVIFSLECGSMKLCVKAAIEQRANLTGAVLRGADLTGADLTDADLTGADLTDANLTGAVLRGADLTGANLTDAVLRGADLTRANLRGANLTDANLTGADLTDAVLRGADLTDAVLTPIRDDIWAVLSAAPGEVEALRAAIINGEINGSAYEGECACLVGTIANARHCNFQEMEFLKPNSSRPAERFFLGIRPGDTPATNQFSAIAIEWIDQWLANVRAAFSVSAN